MEADTDGQADEEAAESTKVTSEECSSEKKDDSAAKEGEAEEEIVAPEKTEGAQKKEEDKGKEEYNKGNYDEAIKAWNMSLKSVKYILDKGFYKNNPEQMQEVHQIHLRVHLNLAQAYLKAIFLSLDSGLLGFQWCSATPSLGLRYSLDRDHRWRKVRDWTQAIEYADKVLNVDDRHTKALYRKAVALDEMGKFEEAVSTLEKLKELEPDNRACQALLAKAKRNGVEFAREQKKAAKKMFAAMTVDRDPRVIDSRGEHSRFSFGGTMPDSGGFMLRCQRRCRDAAAVPLAWPWVQAIWRRLEVFGFLHSEKED